MRCLGSLFEHEKRPAAEFVILRQVLCILPARLPRAAGARSFGVNEVNSDCPTPQAVRQRVSHRGQFPEGTQRDTIILFPKRTDAEEDTAEIDRLEERFVEHPAIAMEQSRCAMNSMARKTQANLGRAFAILEKYSEQTFQLIQEKEQVIDRYEDKLGTYLVKITQRELTHEQTKEISKFLHTVSDFERIADHAVNLSEAAREIAQKRLVFSADARRELTVITSAVQEIVHVSSQAFIEKDQQLALRVEPLEELIDGLCDEMKLHHVQRIQAGECTLTQGFVFNDLLTNLERIADHCSNIAVAMIELEMDSFDTHEYLSSLRKTHDRSFEDYFKEYRQRYSLD